MGGFKDFKKRLVQPVVAGKPANAATVVMIATPILDAVCPELYGYTHSLVQSTLGGRSPFLFDVRCNWSMTPVELARNELVKQFLESKCDYLWFLDADTVPTESTHLVLNSEADVAIGCVVTLMHMDDGTRQVGLNVRGQDEEGNWVPWGPGAPYAPAEGGTANMVVSRRVLEDSRMVVGDHPWEVFTTLRTPGGLVTESEDLNFCRRVRQNLYSLEVVQESLSDHKKNTGIQTVFNSGILAAERMNAFRAQKAAQDAAPPPGGS